MAYAIAYSQVVNAILPREAWDEAYFALLSLKSHLQSMPGWQRFDFWARDLESGEVKIIAVTNWDGPEQLEVWVEQGVTVDSVLRALEPAPTSVEIDLFEEVA